MELSNGSNRTIQKVIKQNFYKYKFSNFHLDTLIAKKFVFRRFDVFFDTFLSIIDFDILFSVVGEKHFLRSIVRFSNQKVSNLNFHTADMYLHEQVVPYRLEKTEFGD